MRSAWASLLVTLIACGGGPGRGDPDDPEAGGGDDVPADADPGPDAEPPFPFVPCGPQRAPLPDLIEDRRVYQQPLERWTVDLTIADLAAFEEVNENVPDAAVAVELADGGFAATGTLSIRGGFSRLNAQKNYKIELDGDARWHGQKEINLNKHMWDVSRVRNKLSFDLMQGIPHLTSLRTQFVEVRVNGASYGLYTWIEEPDKRFLRSHGLDPDGALYKSAIFWFQEIEPEVAEDPELLRVFIEPKANADNPKLLEMIEAVNDDDQDIDEVVARYFNRDNLITWLATNVLVNNIDTRTQNFYLYSPSSCDGWYLLPWDYDGTFAFYGPAGDDARERWEYGISNWWASNLMARFYTRPANVAAIHARVMELAEGHITDAAIAERIAGYRAHVEPFITTMPDLEFLPGSGGDPARAFSRWDAELAEIAVAPTRFRDEYLAALERPMPIFLHAKPVATTGATRFTWDWSFDLQGDPLSYTHQVSRTPLFAPADLVYQQVGPTNRDDVLLAPGTYYWRVIIHDGKTSDSWQLPFDPYDQVIVP